MPGTYRAGCPIVSIAAFEPTLHVMSTRQRPRKIEMRGSDGRTHTFLLKGREDLRQDERVAQLFLLVNNLLSSGAKTHDRSFQIERYAVVPLSTNSGLLRWVPRSDTLHALVREFRVPRNILLNIEHRLMLHMAPDYDQLPLMHKVEVRAPGGGTHPAARAADRPTNTTRRAAPRAPRAMALTPRAVSRRAMRPRGHAQVFEHALASTSGADLSRVMHARSPNSEAWLLRRTFYTRSLAVSSMVGHVLGLGDRRTRPRAQPRV
jgi:FKBP12-rapamycin complex-associated protein